MTASGGGAAARAGAACAAGIARPGGRAERALALARLRDGAAESTRGRRLVVIDGPSGAGKSTLADDLVGEWPGGAELVRLDEVYPGWHGLERGAALLASVLVEPWLRGEQGRVPRWDWAHDVPGPSRSVSAGRDLVIEGCGAFAALARARRGANALAPVAALVPALRIWVRAGEAQRKRAALERDRGAFDPYWELWDEQWRRYVARTGASAARADLVVTGLPNRPLPGTLSSRSH